MPLGDRSRTEEADVRDDVLRVAGLEPGEQVLLAGGLQLEQAQGLAVLDELEREDVVERHLLGVVQVDVAARGLGDLGDGVGHRGLHAYAQDVEFDVAEVLDLLLRGHGHGVVALRGGLHRQPVQEGGVADDHAARVHGHAVDEGVETFRELPQRAVPVRLGGQLPQLGQFGEGAGDVGGPQVREALGDPVDVGGRDAEGETGVPQRPAGPVGLGHRGDRHPFLAEPVEDHVVALQ